MTNAIPVIQGLLGVLLTAGGLFKLGLPHARYSNIHGVAWSKEFTPGQLRLIGFLELSGGGGLVVSLFWHALAWLTPAAAVGVALYMGGAMAIHLRRSEYLHMLGNLVFFLVPALLVAYGRLVGFAP